MTNQLSLPSRDKLTNRALGFAIKDALQPQNADSKNISVNSENLGWIYHLINNSTYAIKTNEKMKIVDEYDQQITLTRFQTNHFNTLLETKYSNAGLTPFKTGATYMISMYVFSKCDRWFMMRALSVNSSPSHGFKFVRANTVERVWCIGVAKDSSTLDLGATATTAYGGSAGGAAPCFMSQAHQTFDGFIGGFQIEAINASYTDGIVIVGDSTHAGSTNDAPSGSNWDQGADYSTISNRQVSSTLGAMLNVCVFNRAIGGYRLDQLDGVWATNITPLAVRAKLVILQGGINDINQSANLATLQSRIQSLITKAIADGFDYLLATVTPNNYSEIDPSKESVRLAYNAWLLSTYTTRVVNIASVVADPNQVNRLRAEYYSDGIHYVGAAKFAVGQYYANFISNYISANNPTWAFKSPSKYTCTGFDVPDSAFIRESTASLNAGATVTGSSRRTVNTLTTSSTFSAYAQKFKAFAGLNQTGTLTIRASSDNGATWFPVSSVALAQVAATGNYGATLTVDIVESMYRAELTNSSASTASSVVLSTLVEW